MQNGWVKLWEETIYNDVWRDDPVAWKIFEYLLVSSYRGTPQGTTVKTLQQITNVCSGKNSTNYKAIQRLKKYQMVKTESNYKKTHFKIVNWWKYQGKESNGKNSVKTEGKLSNTLYKNKDIEEDIYSIYQLYLQAFNTTKDRYKLTNKRKQLLTRRLQDCGPDLITAAIRNTATDDFYAGRTAKWRGADLDWILKSYEQIEKLANLTPKKEVEDERLAKIRRTKA